MKYTLIVRIEPSNHYIHVKGKIENPTGNCFYLNENFTILNVTDGGKDISFVMDKSQPHPPFDVVSKPVFFNTTSKVITFEYEGYITEIIGDINQIDEDIVELGLYSGWFFKPESFENSFDFEVVLDIPKNYHLISNGKVIEGNKIVSVSKENDIVIFASNKVVLIENKIDNVKFIFLCPEDMAPQMNQRAREIAQANQIFVQNYGNIDSNSDITEIISVFRPRGGWGYKRGIVTFVSAEYGRNTKQYHLDFHELAHGWWSIANVSTNDWINEGGAEFSAFIASKAIYGNGYAQEYISKYIKKIIESDCNISIVDTDYKSEHRELNHYVKPTIMFIKASKTFGEKRINDLLMRFFQLFNGTRNATTNKFLDLCDNDMKNFFEKYLFATDWNDLLNDD